VKRNPKPLPPVELLRKRFNYDPATGVITWRQDYFSGGWGGRCLARAGTEAGTISGTRHHRSLTVNGCSYQAHRIAWAIFYGEDPPFELDHKDRNPLNNAIENLRPATTAENGANRKLDTRNTSGCTGIKWCARRRKWQARTGPEIAPLHSL
jgi:hypothetical protein